MRRAGDLTGGGLPVDYYTVFCELEAQLADEFDFVNEASAMEQIGDGGDANQRKRIDAFKIHANSAVIASRRPEAASDRRKAAFELDEMEQALTAFLGRL